MFDASLSADEIIEEYFSALFGEDWRKFHDYLLELAEAIPYNYTARRFTLNENISPYYNPDLVPTIKRTYEILERGRALIKEHYNSDFRVRTVAVRVLEAHTVYAEGLAKALEYKAVGNDERSKELFFELMDKMGKMEPRIERYFDFTQCYFGLQQIFIHSKTNLPENVQNQIQDN
jgi:hypothetical protein